MSRRILIIQGHPDPAGGHLCHALADAYANGAVKRGHEVRQLAVSALDLPLLRRQEDWIAPPPPKVAQCQDAIAWSNHLVIIYPLWHGALPAVLKGFFEQVFREAFVMSADAGGQKWHKGLSGRSARIVVTMGMPALVYRWYFGAHTLKGLERNILRFAGIGPIRETLIGSAGTMPPDRAEKYLSKLRDLGATAR